MTASEQTFDRAREGLRATNASVGDRDLVAILERHGVEEGAVLARYERLGAQANSEAVRYLVNLIMDDERRHHRVMVEIANAVAWANVKGAADVDTVPDLNATRESAELLAATGELIAVEKQDARELKRLRREFKDYADTTLWGLLIDTMLLDTEKHRVILEFISSHVERGEPSRA